MHPCTDIVMGIRITDEFPVYDVVDACLSSLAQHTHNYRLIIVDDNSSPDGSKFIRDCEKNLPKSSIVVHTNYQRWFTRSFNIGMRLVRTPWAVMLNCDTVLDTGWLEELYQVRDIVVSENHNVGMVGSVLSGPEQRRYAVIAHPAYVTGHALLVNMEAITNVSVNRGTPGWYLDETRSDMIHIRSDVDLSFSLMSSGYSVVESYKSAVGHHAGKTWGHKLQSIPTSLSVVNDEY